MRSLWETMQAAAWASREGWEKDPDSRCECGSTVYRREGDWACVAELIGRYRKRSDATA